MHWQKQVEVVARRLEEARSQRGGRLAAVTLAIPDPTMEDQVVDALTRALERAGLVDVQILANTHPGPIRVVSMELVR